MQNGGGCFYYDINYMFFHDETSKSSLARLALGSSRRWRMNCCTGRGIFVLQKRGGKMKRKKKREGFKKIN
jgi:hypothetical protein